MYFFFKLEEWIEKVVTSFHWIQTEPERERGEGDVRGHLSQFESLRETEEEDVRLDSPWFE
jgi:hypothetical protein